MLAELLVGCGGLVDGSYLGEPLFALSGSVFERDVVAPEGVALRVGLFWANGTTSWEEEATTVTTAFPAEYTLDVYAWPPQEVRMTSMGTRYAIAFPLVYADRDGDSRLGPDEQVLGGSPDQVVVFSEAPLHSFGADGSIADLPGGFWRAVPPADAGEVCSLPITSLARPAPATPTDLEIGDAWWTALVDWNCDGSYDEWSGICPDGSAANTWCADADPTEPCADQCDPTTGNTANGNGTTGS